MSKTLGAVPIQDDEYPLMNEAMQWIEHVRYMDSDTLIIKLIFLIIVFLLLLRLLWQCYHVLFPSASLRKRAKQKKIN